jgi:hypothetical protein
MQSEGRKQHGALSPHTCVECTQLCTFKLLCSVINEQGQLKAAEAANFDTYNGRELLITPMTGVHGHPGNTSGPLHT